MFIDSIAVDINEIFIIVVDAHHPVRPAFVVETEMRDEVEALATIAIETGAIHRRRGIVH